MTCVHSFNPRELYCCYGHYNTSNLQVVDGRASGQSLPVGGGGTRISVEVYPTLAYSPGHTTNQRGTKQPGAATSLPSLQAQLLCHLSTCPHSRTLPPPRLCSQLQHLRTRPLLSMLSQQPQPTRAAPAPAVSTTDTRSSDVCSTVHGRTCPPWAQPGLQRKADLLFPQPPATLRV